ncbi:MAG: redoxin domain-containing protein [Candidatus Marinimicrobia bacterium]|nr:redoxin domain-containing protein [Candidatus Neomarinimicrobiota bacterium]MCF7830295.1 redoxin domain-containing protein [Candidatus Neomarinimicrobiota bacterium]MCF7882436.1 redoxin domain-containing protein [Candidatus Neomarinimicrobiota bacterium]
MKKRQLLYLGIALLVNTSLLFGKDLQVGDQAPDFTLPFATKDTINFDGINLSDFYGKQPVVIAFYPADWSSGCTTQMCTFRDNISAFNAIDAEVLGISGDYVFSHKAWIDSMGFQFKLLSDHKHKVAQMYNSYNPKRGFNKRTVYVVDEDGKISYINMEYSPGDPADFDELQQHLSSLGSQ